MKDTLRHIVYLALRHDCVVVPGLGALVCRREPAVYDDAEGVFMPPRRVVGFNPDLSHDDGMLAKSIGLEQDLPFNLAVLRVRRDVDMMRHQLASGGAVHLPGIGTLTAGHDGGGVLFEPELRDPRYNDAYGWLPEVEVKALSAVEQEPESEFVPRVRPWAAIGRAAAVVAAIVTIAIGGLLLGRADLVPGSGADLASLMPLKKAVATEQVAGSVDEGLKVTPIDLCIAAPTVVEPGHGEAYHVVVASFKNMRQARRFVRTRPGYGLEVKVSEGRHRVVCGTAYDYYDADRLRQGVEKRFRGAWVCRM